MGQTYLLQIFHYPIGFLYIGSFILPSFYAYCFCSHTNNVFSINVINDRALFGWWRFNVCRCSFVIPICPSPNLAPAREIGGAGLRVASQLIISLLSSVAIWSLPAKVYDATPILLLIHCKKKSNGRKPQAQ